MNIPSLPALSCFFHTAVAAGALREDRILGDFEGPDFGDWVQIGGDAFGVAPVSRDDPKRRGVKGGVGRQYVCSKTSHPDSEGKLLSPKFVIDRDYLNFFLGGDGHISTSVRLWVDGEVVRRSKGLTRDEMHPWTWDVREFAGREAQIEVRDRGNGNVNRFIMADHFVLSDTPNLGSFEKSVDSLPKYLNLPLSRSGRPATLEVMAEGKLVRKGDVLLSLSNPPDYWISLPLDGVVGKSGVIRFTNVHPNSTAERLIELADTPRKGSGDLEKNEAVRPQFHFSPRNGFMNDPNGLVYQDGVWHLFYQLNAYGLTMNNQSWGHAISRDLIHWEDQPTVLHAYADVKGRSFSGSAVIDRKNRSGFGDGKKPPLVAVFTDTWGSSIQPNGTAECLAYSNDGGKTFTYYSGNPVFNHQEKGRDPKVFWYPAEDREQENGFWVMVTYAVREGKDIVRILNSNDLKNWQETDVVPDVFECPELFKLPVFDMDGELTGQSRWVLQGADATYQIGTFDGKKFIPETSEKYQTTKAPYYAAQNYNNAPNGRVVQIGWLKRHIDWKDQPFSQMMSIPLELSLRETPEGIRLFAVPVRELADFWRNDYTLSDKQIAAGESVAIPLSGGLYDIEYEFSLPKNASLSLEVGDDKVTYPGEGPLAPINTDAKKVRLRIVVDRPSIEVILDVGSAYIPLPRSLSGSQNARLKLTASGDTVILHTLRASEVSAKKSLE